MSRPGFADMRDRLRPRSAYDVVAILALFVALGGTAVAVDGSLPGQNTVGSADIINGEVGPDDVAANAIGSGKIVDATVKNEDLSTGASSSNTIADSGIEGVDVKSNTLKGSDIDESTLLIPDGDSQWYPVDPGSTTSDACAALGGTLVFCSIPTGVAGEFSPWTNYGGQFATAAMYRDDHSVVHLRGLVRNNFQVSSNAVQERPIFKLPTGYQPQTRHVFPSVGSTLGGSEVVQGRVDIQPNGLVTMVHACAAGGVDCSATGGDITLDGIEFRVNN